MPNCFFFILISARYNFIVCPREWVHSIVNSRLEEEITHIAFDIELNYDVVFGKIIENKDSWNMPFAKVMPLHLDIDKEGVHV